MTFAVAEADGDRWRLVRKAHEAAFGPLSAAPPVPVASPLRPQKIHEASPWAEGQEAELQMTAAGASPAQRDALPFKSGGAAPAPMGDALQPHPEMGATKALDGTTPDEGVSIDDLALAPEKFVLAKLEIDQKPDDKATIAGKYGLDVAAWDALRAEYDARSASSPALAERLAGLEKKLGGWLK